MTEKLMTEKLELHRTGREGLLDEIYRLRAELTAKDAKLVSLESQYKGLERDYLQAISNLTAVQMRSTALLVENRACHHAGIQACRLNPMPGMQLTYRTAEALWQGLVEKSKEATKE